MARDYWTEYERKKRQQENQEERLEDVGNYIAWTLFVMFGALIIIALFTN